MPSIRRTALLVVVTYLLLFNARLIAQASCTLSSTNQTITICTPANGATVGTTFHVNAGTTDTLGIQYIEVYVAYKRYALQQRNYLDASITVPTGTHLNMTVQAIDTSGTWIYKTYYINVSSAAYAISPLAPTVSEGTTVQFSANFTSTWSTTCGNISSSGLLKAPLSSTSCTVTGKASDGSGRSASTKVAVTSPITISPSSATTPANQTQQFNANVAVTWKASCGSINAGGLFTAPATAGTCTITATAASGTAYTATAKDTVAASTYSISPQNPTVTEDGTLQFSASANSNWSSSCGTISSSGLFTAPLATPLCNVTGSATDGSGSSASTNVNVTSPITITPTSASTGTGATQQFSANESVTWSTSCGAISSNGLFTAPATPGPCAITATAASGTAYTASVTDTVMNTTSGGLNYTTWKNDNARDGWQSEETILTPADVSSGNFTELFAASVDGRIWAQPLYMSGVSIGSVVHNAVYVATANDSVYAIDGDNGAQLWKVSLLQSGETAANSSTVHSSVQPIVGITGTPVIDPGTGTLYLVSYSVSSTGSYFHRLHAMDITNGAEKFGGPVVINATGWNASQHLQRPGLLLANGNVYIAFSSNEDILPYHGWVFSYSAGTLQQSGVWNDTPNASAGGIWMGGGGIAADPQGNLFVSTGNGDWDGSAVFGQSAVKLSPTLGVLDYFTPINHVSESKGDKDLGSGGMLVLPDSNGAFPHEAVLCSKLDAIYVLNRDHMGELGSTSDNVIQQVSGQLGGASGTQSSDRCFSTAAFWNNNLYFIGNNDVLKQFTFSPSTGMMSTTPASQGSYAFLFPGGQPVVSSNGNNNAIVWAIDWTTGTLRAYDATNVANSLYISPALGTGLKFTVPTVVNGHVYVGLGSKLAGLGLKASGCTPPSSPGAVICSPIAGQTYTSPVTVTAAGTAANGSVRIMELWIDGSKIGNYSGDQMTAVVPLTSGAHALTAVELDTTGASLKSTVVHITVQ